MILFKTCTKCSESKSIDDFAAQAKGRYGVTSICKSCTSERGKKWHANNRERSLATKQLYAAQNRTKMAEYARIWRINNLARSRLKAAEWTKANRDKKAAATAKRRAALLRATPRWASLADISRFYKLAAELTRTTGIKAHVDHIVPLQSSVVCGLHCAANLTILTEKQNKQKSNKWPPVVMEFTKYGLRPIEVQPS